MHFFSVKHFAAFVFSPIVGCFARVAPSTAQALSEAAPWEITLEEMSLLLIRDLLVSLVHTVLS